MPDGVGLDRVAEQFRKFKIQGLLIVGGFEVSFIIVCFEIMTSAAYASVALLEYIMLRYVL